MYICILVAPCFKNLYLLRSEAGDPALAPCFKNILRLEAGDPALRCTIYTIIRARYMAVIIVAIL